ncbi:MAG: hypothetical protein V2A58_15470 [Planctomycetota bacterium]
MRSLYTVALLLVALSSGARAVEAPPDVLATVPGEAVLVIYAPNLARACSGAGSFVQAVSAAAETGDYLSDLMEKFGNPQHVGLKSDGKTVFFLLSIPDFQGEPFGFIFEVDDYKAFRAGSGALTLTRSPGGFDLVTPDPDNPDAGSVMTPLPGNRVLVAGNDRVILEFQQAQGPAISQTLSPEALKTLKGADVGAVLQVDKARKAYAAQIVGIRAMMGSAMAAQRGGSASPQQLAMAKAYQAWMFGAVDQVRSLVLGFSLDAKGIKATIETHAEPDSPFASFLASQDVHAIPGESSFPKDALLSMGWNMNTSSLKNMVRGFMAMALDASEPALAAPDETASEEAKSEYQKTLAERSKRQDAVLSSMEKLMDLTRGDGVCHFYLNPDKKLSMLEVFASKDAAAMKGEYDSSMTAWLPLMKGMQQGVEFEYQANAREFLGQPASVWRMKSTGQTPSPSPFAGPMPAFLKDGEFLLFAKGDSLVIVLNETEERVAQFLASAGTSQAGLLPPGFPERRNFLLVGSYASLLSTMLGLPGSEASPESSAKLALSLSCEPAALSACVVCPVDEIIRFKNFAMSAAMAAQRQAAPVEVAPVEKEGGEEPTQ